MLIFPPHLTIILAVIAVFCGAVLGTAFVRRLAFQYGWMVLPRDDRWHRKPTAQHGGIGFYPAFLCGSLWVLEWKCGAEQPGWCSLEGGPGGEVGLAAAVLLGSLLMFSLGLWDDLKQLRPATKLVGQVVAASLFVGMGGVFPLTNLQLVNFLVTYFWFIGITNAVNLLDNMDGLASGVVIIAGMALVTLALPAHGPTSSGVLVVPLGLMFTAALGGFWVHNRPRASIFMGDSGSLCIGYVLAALAVPSPLNGFVGVRMGESVLGPVLALLIPATVVAVPIFDTTLVTITRTWWAQKASQGGRDHTSHRLVGLGFSETKAVWMLYSLATFGGIIAVLMQWFPEQSLPLFGLFGLVLMLAGVYLGHVKVQAIDPSQKPAAWTPLVSNLLYKRRAGEVLLDVVLIVLCFYSAYLLRFEGILSPPTLQAVVHALPMVVGGCLCAYFCAGIYRGQWRLISLAELPCYAMGVSLGTVLSLAVVTLITRFDIGHSRSAYIIFGILLFLALVGSRLSFRLFDALVVHEGVRSVSTHQKKPVLIYGAGKAGKLLYEEMMCHPQMQDYVAVGFIDDDPHRVGYRLCGVPVKHGWEWLRQPWDCAPEIWISSQFVPDERAVPLALRWQERAVIRRLRLHMDLLLPNSVLMLSTESSAEREQSSTTKDGIAQV